MEIEGDAACLYLPRGGGDAPAALALALAMHRAFHARQAWMVGRNMQSYPPHVRFNGLRAAGYSLAPQAELVSALSASHEAVFGSPPPVQRGLATTDARHYINQVQIPAACYGPTTRDIHGVDEAVNIPSIVNGARVLGRFLIHWLGDCP